VAEGLRRVSVTQGMLSASASAVPVGRGMSGAEVAVVTVLITGGFMLLAAVLGPFAKSRWIDPLQERKKTVKKVAQALSNYRNVGPDAPTSSASRAAEARKTYRDHSAELRSNLEVLSPHAYGVFSWLRLVLPKEQVRHAASNLNILASTAQKGPQAEDVNRARYEVKKNLKIRN
jgi:hypothetical protein